MFGKSTLLQLGQLSKILTQDAGALAMFTSFNSVNAPWYIEDNAVLSEFTVSDSKFFRRVIELTLIADLTQVSPIVNSVIKGAICSVMSTI